MPDGKGVGFASLAIGSIFLYGGVKGYSILKATQNIVQGKSANVGQNESTLSDPTTTSFPGSSTTPATPAGHYDHTSLMTLWISVGGTQSSASNAACHAMQESSGNPKAMSGNPDGGQNVGLWQLDTKGVGAGHTVAQLQDPVTNARITVQATRDPRTGDNTNWSEWATPGC